MNTIKFGDCRDTMRQWASEGVKVQTCVTSPPYFGLRDYGHEGQIGLEQTPEEYIAAMVEVFRCVRDILADDGTLWLNIGDSYARQAGDDSTRGTPNTGHKRVMEAKADRSGKGNNRPPPGYKNKDLIGIPWMLAFALRADGWYLRQDIIWHKPNPMPESVRDRCTKAHEYIFLLSKSERYFFDSEAIKEPSVTSPEMQVAKRNKAPHKGQRDSGMRETTGGFDKITKVYDMRNRRSVWTVTTKPYKGAHFATFPPDLIEPCILAGSSEKGHCPECGARWSRIVERAKPPVVENSDLNRYGDGSAGIHRKVGQAYQNWLNENPKITIGWKPACNCGHDPVPDIVLDPFMGSGTTAQVAIQHNRQYLGCELNPEYKALQDQRIENARERNRTLSGLARRDARGQGVQVQEPLAAWRGGPCDLFA